ncbi:MAG: lipoyl(octanoyl) transferase LipB [Burkholderiaceae bacterium]|nr:lipoyl(octanoyl) transferase LipB [Burkholderiaceae bacterium]
MNAAAMSAARAASILVRPFAPVDYQHALTQMREFTAARGPQTQDEIWLVEHPAVFTLGMASRERHLLATGDIPVVQTERGGQVTYHGPGQVLAYLLLDLRRRGLTVRTLVHGIEQAAIGTLAAAGVTAMRRAGAPGVYVRRADGEPGAKIAAVGIRVQRGCSFHGLAVNVAMDLEPFSRIDPCGYPGLEVTDVRSQMSAPADLAAFAADLGERLRQHFEEPR